MTVDKLPTRSSERFTEHSLKTVRSGCYHVLFNPTGVESFLCHDRCSGSGGEPSARRIAATSSQNIVLSGSLVTSGSSNFLARLQAAKREGAAAINRPLACATGSRSAGLEPKEHRLATGRMSCVHTRLACMKPPSPSFQGPAVTFVMTASSRKMDRTRRAQFLAYRVFSRQPSQC